MDEEIKSTIIERAQRKIQEDNMGLYARESVDLFIKGLTKKEYEEFISFIKTKTPTGKGFEAIQVLMRSYELVRQSEKLVGYIDELQEKIKVLEESKKVEEKPKKKYIGGEE